MSIFDTPQGQGPEGPEGPQHPEWQDGLPGPQQNAYIQYPAQYGGQQFHRGYTAALHDKNAQISIAIKGLSEFAGEMLGILTRVITAASTGGFTTGGAAALGAGLGAWLGPSFGLGQYAKETLNLRHVDPKSRAVNGAAGAGIGILINLGLRFLAEIGRGQR